MNKKIVSLMVALTLPLTFLVGCKKSSPESSPKKEDTFVMTESTIAKDGDAEYSAESYKKAFFSTENYSVDSLQNEFETMVSEITKKEDKDELLKLLDSYSNTNDGDFEVLKSTYEKYNSEDEDTKTITLDSNSMHEISSRLYKATLNATKKYYDINDFYIYYKNHLSDSLNTNDEEEFENEVRMTTIKEFTIANIYKTAYNDSFISKIKVSVEQSSTNTEKEENKTQGQVVQNKPSTETTKPLTTTKPSTNESSVDKEEVTENESTDEVDDNDSYEDSLELTETVKSQIYDAGVNCAIDFIALGENKPESPSKYCREIYEGLENDNNLGDSKEEGYKSFLEGFKTTLENNNIEFN